MARAGPTKEMFCSSSTLKVANALRLPLILARIKKAAREFLSKLERRVNVDGLSSLPASWRRKLSPSGQDECLFSMLYRTRPLGTHETSLNRRLLSLLAPSGEASVVWGFI